MPTWNMYSEEVHAERARLQDYGVAHRGEPPHAPSYKAQALRELARRLELETQLQDVHAKLARAVDRFEAAETALDIARLPLERAPG